MAIEMIQIEREMGVQPDGRLVQRYKIQVGINTDPVATDQGFLIRSTAAPEFSEVVEFLSDALADLIEAKRDGKSFTPMP